VNCYCGLYALNSTYETNKRIVFLSLGGVSGLRCNMLCTMWFNRYNNDVGDSDSGPLTQWTSFFV